MSTPPNRPAKTSGTSPRARHAMLPGTFDPPTLGHVALVRRAREMFEHVTIALADNPGKQTLFSVDERLALLRASLVDMDDVAIERVAGLTVHGASKLGCDVIVRGVRSGTDFDYEVTLARNNRAMLPSIDTVLLVPDPAVAHITSTIVRQVATLGGDAAQFVPEAVARALMDKAAR